MAERSQYSNSNDNDDDFSEGLESLSLCDSENEEDNNDDCDNEEDNNEEVGEMRSVEFYRIDSVADLGCILFDQLSPDEVKLFNFANVDLAYEFFNEYAKAKGFSLRKHKVGNSRKGGLLWKSFVCSRQGIRDSKFLKNPNRQREARNNSRCGCLAEFQVHIDAPGIRWYVSLMNDEHNHEIFSDRFVGRLRSHCRMSDAAIAEMNSMKKAGISTSIIYGSFAQESGGYANVPFNKRKMYNELAKERKRQKGDAKSALGYLREMAALDPKMYWRHVVDDEGKLRHLFWCDGESVVDYSVFGDVLAFDATYGRNKYKLPVIVFSGVNHHRQTVVFGCAVVSDETERTYTWILEQFLCAMEGKSPKAVITDGDKSMRNAIKHVFPDAHHRLCAWHLMRNAKSNVKKPEFKNGFRKLMYNTYHVEEFEAEWKKLIAENGVEDKDWVQEMYANKKMWAATYMRGMFFAGFRTTSRCEGLHTQIGKYVGSRDSLYEFIWHFDRCLDYIRNNEVEADYRSCNSRGDVVMSTYVPTLEMHASKIYTKEVFLIVRDKLLQLASVNVVGSKKTATSVIYVVNKYSQAYVKTVWHVSYYAIDEEWRCSCKGMETYDIPCLHILSVLVHLDKHEIPNSLVCKRWTKNAKEGLEHRDVMGNTSNAAHRCIRLAALQHSCRRMCSVASRSLEYYNEAQEMVNAQTENFLKLLDSACPSGSTVGFDVHENVRDPECVRTKGCGPSGQVRERKLKKPRLCSTCGEEGHNKRTCTSSQHSEPVESTTVDDPDDEDVYEESDEHDSENE